ncbi:MAG TPA: hypothetical protein VNU46_02855 [Gemmatimonadaceae bacterium]|jgi:hypothetical protein|nr:hypothetical protein [Gemmatimonadaceae bacterium]
MHETPRLLGFVRLASYERSAAEVLTDDDERQLEAVLMENPEAGSRVIGAGGARKVRVGRADHGRGKRGGARVIYSAVWLDASTCSTLTLRAPATI